MRKRIISRFRKRPVLSAAQVLFALAVASVLTVQGVMWSQWSVFAVGTWAATAAGALETRVASLAGPDVAQRMFGPSERAVLPFSYRGRTYFVAVTVPAAELRAARVLPTEFVFGSRGRYRQAYVRTMVSSAQRDPVIEAACVQLRATRDRLGLDDDAYAELIARFVQQIPYGYAAPRFGAPSVVFADGRGVCADKTILLASLLRHEGYGAAVVAIDSNSHAAVAVRGTSFGYLHTGYAYIETTIDAYIGEVPPESGGAGPVEARTQVVPVGGWRVYQSDLESEFVGETLVRAKQAARALAPYRGYAERGPADSRSTFAGMAERHGEAVELAGELRRAQDDRERTYALMTRSGGR